MATSNQDSAAPAPNPKRRFLEPTSKDQSKLGWVPDALVQACFSCTAPFSVFRRRHHCRRCLIIVCDECSPFRVCLPLSEQRQREVAATQHGAAVAVQQHAATHTGIKYMQQRFEPVRICCECHAEMAAARRGVNVAALRRYIAQNAVPTEGSEQDTQSLVQQLMNVAERVDVSALVRPPSVSSAKAATASEQLAARDSNSGKTPAQQRSAAAGRTTKEAGANRLKWKLELSNVARAIAQQEQTLKLAHASDVELDMTAFMKTMNSLAKQAARLQDKLTEARLEAGVVVTVALQVSAIGAQEVASESSTARSSSSKEKRGGSKRSNIGNEGLGMVDTSTNANPSADAVAFGAVRQKAQQQRQQSAMVVPTWRYRYLCVTPPPNCIVALTAPLKPNPANRHLGAYGATQQHQQAGLSATGKEGGKDDGAENSKAPPGDQAADEGSTIRFRFIRSIGDLLTVEPCGLKSSTGVTSGVGGGAGLTGGTGGVGGRGPNSDASESVAGTKAANVMAKVAGAVMKGVNLMGGGAPLLGIDRRHGAKQGVVIKWREKATLGLTVVSAKDRKKKRKAAAAAAAAAASDGSRSGTSNAAKVGSKRTGYSGGADMSAMVLSSEASTSASVGEPHCEESCKFELLDSPEAVAVRQQASLDKKRRNAVAVSADGTVVAGAGGGAGGNSGGGIGGGDTSIAQEEARDHELRIEVLDVFHGYLRWHAGIVRAQNIVMADRAGEMSTAVSWDKKEHAELLRELWSLYVPDRPFPGQRHEEWKCIGFQGEDPVSDFRGMGLLGLCTLIYMGKAHKAETLALVALQTGRQYPLCCVVINIVAVVADVLNLKRVPTVSSRSGSEPYQKRNSKEQGGDENGTSGVSLSENNGLFRVLCLSDDAAHLGCRAEDMFFELVYTMLLVLERHWVETKCTYFQFPFLLAHLRACLNAALARGPVSFRWLVRLVSESPMPPPLPLPSHTSAAEIAAAAEEAARMTMEDAALKQRERLLAGNDGAADVSAGMMEDNGGRIVDRGYINEFVDAPVRAPLSRDSIGQYMA